MSNKIPIGSALEDSTPNEDGTHSVLIQLCPPYELKNKYNKPLLKCPICNKLPKLNKKDYYSQYACIRGCNSTFFSKNECTARELWVSAISRLQKSI